MLPVITNMGGMSLAFPDVCNTPTPAGPVPTPYPNISMGPTMNVGTSPVRVFVGNMKAATVTTKCTTTTGDEAGVAGGVMSGMIKGPSTYMLGSFRVFYEGKPVSYLVGLVGHNGAGAPNAPPGVSVVPSQIKTFVGP